MAKSALTILLCAEAPSFLVRAADVRRLLQVQNFPFPSPPEAGALQAATTCLTALSALTNPGNSRQQQPRPAGASASKLTAIGKAMSVFPVSPRHSRMLLQLAVWQQRALHKSTSSSSSIGGMSGDACLRGAGPLGGVSGLSSHEGAPVAVALAAALSSESPFMHLDALSSHLEADTAAAAAAAADGGAGEPADGAGLHAQNKDSSTTTPASKKKAAQAAAAAHATFRSVHGDALSSLNVLCAYEQAAAAGQAEEFCAQNVLHVRHLREMSQLRQQLGRMLLQLHRQTMQREELPLTTAAAAAAVAGAADMQGGVLGSSGSSEALELLKLLMGAVDQGGAEQLVEPLPPPSTVVLDVLRRAVATGWCDQVGCCLVGVG